MDKGEAVVRERNGGGRRRVRREKTWCEKTNAFKMRTHEEEKKMRKASLRGQKLLLEGEGRDGRHEGRGASGKARKNIREGGKERGDHLITQERIRERKKWGGRT